ncbi:hypothetical protein JKG47_00950 [Acidithiobacillus sp. MC6.1]|nr:hypothetical protein [Acidithiobacillus sp. MC6.1]
MSYETDFQAALVFSNGIGLKTPRWNIQPRLFLDGDKVRNKLHDVMIDIIGNPPRIGNLSAQCVPVHTAAIKKVAAIVGTEPVLTFGCVTSETGDKLFSLTEDEIQRWLKNGVENPFSLELHAWLTLSSMEIIDFTILPTITDVQRMKNPAIKQIGFGVVAKHADALIGMTYKPIAIGNDLTDKLHFSLLIIV